MKNIYLNFAMIVIFYENTEGYAFLSRLDYVMF